MGRLTNFYLGLDLSIRSSIRFMQFIDRNKFLEICLDKTSFCYLLLG